MIKTIFFFFFVTSLYGNEFINVNFKNLKLKELIKITSDQINKSILLPHDIKGRVDFMSNKPLKKEKLLSILKYSLEANGYRLILNDNIYRVVKSDFKLQKNSSDQKVLKKRIYKEKDINQISEISYYSEVVSLSNIEAKSLEKILKSIITQRVYKKNYKPSISINEELNSIILDGGYEEVLSLKKIIEKLDITKEQVFIKAKIIELDNNLLEDIGIKFGILGGKVHSGGIYTFSSNLNNGKAFAIDTGSIGLKIPNVTSSLALGASLSLLHKTYALDIISEPSILCINNKESSIYVGETVSIQTGSVTTDGGSTKTTFEREDIGLTLKVKPRVSYENKINLEINTILEGIKNNNTNFNPDTSKKELRTSAIVNNGESVILGGLIERKNQKTVQKVPYASDVPLIGELFKNRINDSQNKSLVLIVTPYVIPKSKDLTYVRKELSKLKRLEDEFLEKVLLDLRKNKIRNQSLEESKKRLTNEEIHRQNLKEYFGI